MASPFNAAGEIVSLLPEQIIRSFLADGDSQAGQFVFNDTAGFAELNAVDSAPESQSTSASPVDAHVTSASFGFDAFNFSPAKDHSESNPSSHESETAARDVDSAPVVGSHTTFTDLHINLLPDDASFNIASLSVPSSISTMPPAAVVVFTPPVQPDPVYSAVPHAPETSAGESPDASIPISATPTTFDDGPAGVLVNGDGEIVSVISNSTAGSSGGSGKSSGGSTTTSGTTSTSPFVINVSYDASVNNAPAAFKADVAAVVSYFESRFTDYVNININVGYGEVGGYTLGSGALGESLTYLSSYSYSQIKNALTADAKTADDTSSVASLGATSPISGTFWTATAEAKALGLMSASSQVDGYVGFASGNFFDYNSSDGITAGQYDFYGAVAHEITEVMGRSLFVGETIGTTNNSYNVLDLFHFSANGVRDFSGSTPGYFSVNGGATNLNNFNTNPGGDYGDWASSAGNDAFSAFASSGVVDAISQTDLRELDVLGWDRGTSSSTPSTPPPITTKADLVIGKFSFTGSHFSFEVDNAGGSSASSSSVGIYASTAAGGPTSLIGTVGTPTLAAGGADTESSAISWGSGTIGTYYIRVAADYKNVVAESNESNNQSGQIALVIGNSSNNTLTGTSGNDVIFGMGGKDMLTGGTGADQFVFNTALNASTNLATVADFSHAQGDIIDLDHTIFTKLTTGALGAVLASNDFYASANGAAHLATDRILYNTTTGALSYDTDGTGAAAGIQFAIVTLHPMLASTDFHLV